MLISGEEEEEKSIHYKIRSRIKRIMDLIPALTFYHTINRVRKRRRRGRRQKGGGKVDFEQYNKNPNRSVYKFPPHYIYLTPGFFLHFMKCVLQFVMSFVSRNSLSPLRHIGGRGHQL